MLMAVPDDFISHVGMSIICDEEGKMDDAIWHMERAFESQPSNAAIQGELQRLYGRRDGVEPPKIRMTRGALAHMYVQGELHPQAISELRAVLHQDSQRADMQVLLARALFRRGQKADASDICAQLLKRYPYCFDANRFMVELLHGGENTESAQLYRQRVNQLDPYAAFAKESVFRSEEVADATVNVERLEYRGQDVDMDKGWGASMGIGLTAAAKNDGQPEWLKAGLSKSQPDASAPRAPLDHKPAEAEPAAISQNKPDLPDFLRQAGWTESSNTAEENALSFESTPESVSDPLSSVQDELTPADLPDWLKDRMPTDKATPTTVPAKPMPSEAKASPEKGDSFGSRFNDASADAVRRLSAVLEDKPAPETPDWLNSLKAAEVEQPAASGEGIPAWLRDLEASKPAESQPEEFPDWLKGLGGPETQGTDIESLVREEAATQEPVSKPVEPIVLGKLDWGPDLPEKAEPPKAEKPESTLDMPGGSEKKQEDALAWLEMLAAKNGAKPEELVTGPAAGTEKPPELVEQARWITEHQPQAPKLPHSEEVVPEDETGMWLRGLADKEIPGEAAEGKPAGELTEEEEPLLSEQDTQDWLRNLQGETVEAATPSGDSDVPEWLKSRQPKAADSGSLASESFDSTEGRPASETSLPEQSDMPGWLREMDQETSSELAESDTLGPAADKPAASGRSDVPDWLRGLQAPPPGNLQQAPSAETSLRDAWQEAAGAKVESEERPEEPVMPDLLSENQASEEPIDGETNAADLPEWLRGLDKDAAEPRLEASEELPLWLKGETEALPEAEPTAPSDWHPVEPKAEPSPTPEGQKPPPAPVRPTEGVAPTNDSALTNAQKEMSRGDIPAAVDQYNKLIRKGRFLEETIRDLREALYRYPVEVSIWQTLGDAYMRANRLQEALDAFNKAEELLR
ncbi:MAG: hypothetical protein A2W33_01025 [Chloroflexi bacterium RBG_16_52_11]|nr:MAG: hypothetical protein A2W33_01025 [Chloroflexi bacterium RBG_16_52_11]